jgi:outer membrane receptor protein involved in Fe transport
MSMRNWLHTAATALALTVPVAAAPAAIAQVAETQSMITIPAQPMADAIAAFSRQTEVTVLADRALLANLTSQAVSGTHTPQSALETMLRGSALIARQTGPRAFAVARADNVDQTRTEPAALAPEADADIIVTAQKRAQNLQDVPLAVTALSGDDVRERDITDFTRLVDEVPGVSINYAFGGANYGLLSIRGIGGADDYKPNGNPSVALHLDGVYQTSNAYLGMPLFDLERVEVLKGPQGTLYGRNTTAGVVNAITRGPGQEFDGFADARIAAFDYRAFEGAVGGPISDKLGLRVAVFAEQGGGFMDGRGAGLVAGFRPTIGGVVQTQVPAIADPGPREGFGDKNMLAARATLTFDFTAASTLTLRAFASRDRGDTRQYDRISRTLDATIFNAGEDSDPFVFFSNQYYRHNIDVSGFSGELSHQLTNTLDLTVLAGVQGSERRVGGNGDGTSYPQFEFLFDEELSQGSLEARVSDAEGGRFDWIAGVFYVTDTIDFDSTWTSLSVRSVYDSPYAQTRSSFAVFGQADMFVTDALKLSAGLRYTDDQVDYSGANIDRNPWGISTYNASFGTTSPFSWDRSFTDDNISGRLTAQYFFSDDINVFASYGTGYRGGGFDGTSIFTLAETLPFNSETVEAIEGGARWSNSRFRLSLDAFRYEFEDLQATTRLANDTNGRTNVGAAWTEGLELASSALLVDLDAQSLEARFALALLDSKITAFQSNRVADVRATIGDPLPGAPDVSGAFSLLHRVTFANNWSLNSRADIAHHGEESNRLNALPNNTTKPYTLLNARLELGAPSGWAVYAYGRNLTDEVYFPELNGASRLVGAPRTYGVGLRTSF